MEEIVGPNWGHLPTPELGVPGSDPFSKDKISTPVSWSAEVVRWRGIEPYLPTSTETLRPQLKMVEGHRYQNRAVEAWGFGKRGTMCSQGIGRELPH